MLFLSFIIESLAVENKESDKGKGTTNSHFLAKY
jgi:hypothetical protein